MLHQPLILTDLKIPVNVSKAIETPTAISNPLIGAKNSNRLTNI